MECRQESQAVIKMCIRDSLYRVHQKSIGWSEWGNNGEWAGTTGKGLQMEALEIKKSMFSVEPHVQSKGWLSPKAAENVIGITGHALRLEAIRINPYGKTIKAKVDVYKRQIYTRALDSHGRPTKIVRCTDAYCTICLLYTSYYQIK